MLSHTQFIFFAGQRFYIISSDTTLLTTLSVQEVVAHATEPEQISFMEDMPLALTFLVCRNS